MHSNFTGTMLASSIVSKNIDASLRFYQQALGFNIIEEGLLSIVQKEQFGQHLNRYILIGHDRGSAIRIIETTDKNAIPNRLNANPWDIGLCVLEAGSPDVDKIYQRLLRHRYGTITPPLQFAVTGPEPLGYVLMKAVGTFGPSGEQLFITEISEREGGTPLWELRQDIPVLPPANSVISLKNRKAQEFYKKVFALEPAIDLHLNQTDAALLMGGPPDMSFRMCLMGNGSYKSGMEQHVYGDAHPDFNYDIYPCDFSKTGLASLCWQGQYLENCEERVIAHGGKIIGETLLPIRNNPCPKGVVYQGLAGEIIELAL